VASVGAVITDLPDHRPSEATRDSLASVIAAGDGQEPVRDEIRASWQRSLHTGLRPDRFDVPHDPDIDSDALLVRAARPVLDQLADDLASTRMSVLLTDGRAHVLDRRAPERSLQNRLDGISLAPGFVYAEGLIGTNAIGTALAQGAASFVDGTEHFADVLTTMACAAVPVTDPRDGRTLGAVDLTCWADDASPLMLPLVMRAAREIEQRLIDDARVAARVVSPRVRASAGGHGSSNRGPARARFGWESLTATERSVIALVAQGLTNREAAERLIISRYTVDSHMRAIFRKLEVRSRVELTRAAVEHEEAPYHG
jgi:DNA-binding CsgD family transcriptional regulator